MADRFSNAAEIADLMQQCIDGEMTRLGAGATPVERGMVQFHADLPGVLFAREIGGQRHPVSFFSALTVLQALPNGAGMQAVRGAMEAARGAGKLHPPRQPHTLQVGYKFGSARVDTILLGRDYNSAKNGDPVEMLGWDFLAMPQNAERVVVGLSEDGNGFWRRGTQLRQPDRLPQVIESKILNRSLHQRSVRAVAHARIHREKSPDHARRFAILSKLMVHLEHAVSVGNRVIPNLQEERLFLRSWLRSVRGQRSLMGMSSPNWIGSEQDACRERLSQIGRELRPAPAPRM